MKNMKNIGICWKKKLDDGNILENDVEISENNEEIIKWENIKWIYKQDERILEKDEWI